MFGWFRRSRRILFAFRDGNGRVRRVDPVTVERALEDALGFEWTARVAALGAAAPPGLVGDAVESDRKRRRDERDRVLRAVNTAFGVTPYAEDERGRVSGLTEIERFGLLDGYQRFVLTLLEASRPFVNAQPRASPSPEPPPPPSGPECTSDAPPLHAPAPAN
jgi:hypothetical protein